MSADDIGVALECAALVGVITGYPPAWSTRKRLTIAMTAAAGGTAFLIGAGWEAGAACLILGAVIAAGPWLPGTGKWRR